MAEYGTGALNIEGSRVAYRDPADVIGATVGFAASRATGKAMQSVVFERESRSGEDNFDPSLLGRWPSNVIHDGSEEVLEIFPEAGAGSSASRYFYCAKANSQDRSEGLAGGSNIHPTVKPTDLMRYLCRLVTPPGGVVLDPFMGSGSTGKGAILEGFAFIGIEREADYSAIAKARIDHALGLERAASQPGAREMAVSKIAKHLPPDLFSQVLP